MTELEQAISDSITEQMPDIIQAMQYKLDMLTREVAIATHFGLDDNATRLHIKRTQDELDKLNNLIAKLQRA